MAADAELMALRQEEVDLLAQLEALPAEEHAAATASGGTAATASRGAAQQAPMRKDRDEDEDEEDEGDYDEDEEDGEGAAGARGGAAGAKEGEEGEHHHLDLTERLNEVYERMGQISASTAESRASKILHGLGFTDVMQKRSTNSFRCGGQA